MSENRDDGLNKEQGEVADFYNKNLLVSAGAGSGKTRVVIAKIVQIIKTRKASVTELLVTTFTKAAAAQMLGKLAEKLSDEIVKGDDSAYLMEQLELLSDASIGTLHTFCEKIIKKYFYAINIEPTFRIIEEKDADFFKNQILDDIIQQYNEQDDKIFKKLVSIFSSKRSLVEFKQKINKLFSFVKAKDGYTSYFKDVIDDKTKSEKIITEIIQGYIIDRVNSAINVYKDIVKESQFIGVEKIGNFAKETIVILQKINKNNTLSDNIYLFKNINFKTLNGVKPKKGTPEENSLYEKLKLSHNAVKKIIIDSSIFDGINENTVFFADTSVLKKLFEVLEKFDYEYHEFKKDKSFCDFNDLEEYMLEILKNQDVKELIKKQYKYIFVDEYQDTNEIQEKIINSISNGNNLIMVGDVKQSIYGFRNSSPEIFLDKYNNYSIGNGGELKFLRLNYRSQKVILDYCNYLFGKLMKTRTSGIDYKSNHSFELGNDSGNDTSSVDFYLYSPDEKKDVIDKIYDINSQTSKRDYELDLLVKSVYDVTYSQIYDDKLCEYRKCEYGDISILCKDHKQINKIIKKFALLDIPYSAKYQINLYKDEGVNLILEFLQVIQNDFDDIAVTTCLSSFCYNVTEDELMKIKSINAEKVNFYTIVKQYLQEYDNEISQKINKFYTDISELRELKNIMSLYDIVSYIMNKFNFMAYYLLKSDGKIRKQNLNVYLETLKEGFYTKDLTSYLSYIKGFAINDSFDVYISGGKNSVNIQTIHNSKGLEYNVVILYQPNKKYNDSDWAKEILLKEKDLGVTMYDIDVDENTKKDTLGTVAYKIRMSENAKKEQIRLLYVALTRAKNKIIVVSKKSKNYSSFADNSDYEIMKASNNLSLMLGSLSVDELEKLDDGVSINYNGSTFNFKTYHPDDIIEYQKEEKNTGEEQINVSELINISNYKYSFDSSRGISLKNTVTALQEESGYHDFLNKKIAEQNEEISPLEKGNSYHYIMQKSELDLNNIKMLKTLPEYKNVNETEIINAINKVGKIADGRIKHYEKMFMMYVDRAMFVKDSPHEKILVQGVVDLVLEGEKDIILLDYKTTRASADKLKTMYKTQLDLYSVALENYFEKKVTKKYIYSFVNNSLVDVD